MSPAGRPEPATFGPIDAGDLRELAQILADPNPIHLDAAAAAEVGLGDRPVAQGPLAVGYLLSAVARTWPQAAIRAVDLGFFGPVFAGDRPAVTVETGPADGGLVTGEVRVEVDGHRVVAGQVTLAVDPEGH
ncbi:MAG TPA: MaoC family dehydratase [Acidimicrobiia bacterium]|nr:MaoC family dehydratase [Acidimicrobiia bacterium]